MIARFIIAAVGGGIITTGMLLGMNQFAQQFKEQDPTRYFSVTDFVALPEPRKPRPPQAPMLPPDRPQIDVRVTDDSRLPVRLPSVDSERLTPPPLVPEGQPAPDSRRGPY